MNTFASRLLIARLALPVALAAAFLAGCATPPAPTTAAITYESEPAGATIFEGGKSLGVAPVMRRYEANGAPQITTPDVTAVWPSGAKTTFFTIVKPGDDRVATLDRPKNAPGLDADLANAQKIKLEQAQAAEREKGRALADQKRASAACLAQRAGTGVKSSADQCN